jgi:hypothetical protein
VCIKSGFKLRKNATETFEMLLKVRFREQKMGRTQVSEWFSKFKNAVTSAEDAKRSGCALTNKT